MRGGWLGEALISRSELGGGKELTIFEYPGHTTQVKKLLDSKVAGFWHIAVLYRANIAFLMCFIS